MIHTFISIYTVIFGVMTLASTVAAIVYTNKEYYEYLQVWFKSLTVYTIVTILMVLIGAI